MRNPHPRTEGGRVDPTHPSIGGVDPTHPQPRHQGMVDRVDKVHTARRPEYPATQMGLKINTNREG